jgi:hypothetical protein
MQVTTNEKSPMLVPVASIEDSKKMLDMFMEFKQNLLAKSDKQIFKFKNRETGQWEDKEFCKKAGCQKLAVVFNLSCDIITQQVEHLPDGKIIARVQAKAIHVPSGRYWTASAACSSDEKMQEVFDKEGKPTGEKRLFNPARVEHDVLSHAQTRASNRAVLSILGSGEISAEEMEQEHIHDSKTPSSFCPCKEGPQTGIDGKCKRCGLYSKLYWESHNPR